MTILYGLTLFFSVGLYLINTFYEEKYDEITTTVGTLNFLDYTKDVDLEMNGRYPIF